MRQLPINTKHIVIAIDGPAGSGKSSLAKIIADKFNFLYIDTGAMYRALALKVITNNYDLNNHHHLEKIINQTTISYNDQRQLMIDDKIIDEQIRSSLVTNKVSEVALIKEIRQFLVASQRKLGLQFNSILDGRDIGTVVFPDANLKIFLTASIAIRAERRFLQNQLNNRNLEISLAAIKSSIAQRDHQDSTRVIGALKQASDAILIDNTNADLNTTVSEIEKLIKKIIIKDAK